MKKTHSICMASSGFDLHVDVICVKSTEHAFCKSNGFLHSKFVVKIRLADFMELASIHDDCDSPISFDDYAR